MSSRDPRELKSELEEIEFSGDSEQLGELRAEARATVDAQRETLADIDTKASKILRLNIALVGILISVVSIATQLSSGQRSGVGTVEPFLNSYTVLGVGALVLSTAFAAMTYTASELDVGVSSENLTKLLNSDFQQQETEVLLIQNYIMRINFNRSTNVRNIPLVQVTILLIVSAIISFALGLYNGIAGTVPIWLLIPSILLLTVVVLVSGLPTQTHRAITDLRAWR